MSFSFDSKASFILKRSPSTPLSIEIYVDLVSVLLLFIYGIVMARASSAADHKGILELQGTVQTISGESGRWNGHTDDGQYIDGDLGVLQNPINQEYLLLDSNRAVNYTWTKNFGPNVAMGFPLSNIRVDAEIIGKGETQTVASIVYANVIRVKYKYTATVFLVGDVPVAEEERWYARGIGVIRSSIMNLVAPATIVNETTRAQIF